MVSLNFSVLSIYLHPDVKKIVVVPVQQFFLLYMEQKERFIYKKKIKYCFDHFEKCLESQINFENSQF